MAISSKCELFLENLSNQQEIVCKRLTHWSQEDVRAIGEAIEHNSTLTSVAIESAARLGRTYSIHGSGEISLECDIQQLFIERSLCAVIRNPHVETFRLSSHYLNTTTASLLGELVSSHSSLRSLSLIKTSSSSKAFECVAGALSLTTSLVSLNLSGSCSAEQMPILAEALKDNPPLESVDLSYNSINAFGFSAMGEALRVNTALTELDLGECTMRPQLSISAFLIQVISRNNFLRSLNLNCKTKRNYVFEERALTLIKGAFSTNTALESLQLGGSNIGSRYFAPWLGRNKHNRMMKEMELRNLLMPWLDSRKREIVEISPLSEERTPSLEEVYSPPLQALRID